MSSDNANPDGNTFEFSEDGGVVWSGDTSDHDRHVADDYQLLLRWSSVGLTSDEQADVNSHLAHCAVCRRLVADMVADDWRDFRFTMGPTPLTEGAPPVDAQQDHPGLRPVVVPADTAKPRHHEPATRRTTTWHWWALAAGLAGVLAGAWWMVRPVGPPAQIASLPSLSTSLRFDFYGDYPGSKSAIKSGDDGTDAIRTLRGREIDRLRNRPGLSEVEQRHLDGFQHFVDGDVATALAIFQEIAALAASDQIRLSPAAHNQLRIHIATCFEALDDHERAKAYWREVYETTDDDILKDDVAGMLE